jgi:hypothetical protein
MNQSKSKCNKYGCRVSGDVCLIHDEPLTFKNGCSQAFTESEVKEDWEEKWNYFVKDVREYGDFPEILVSHIKSFISKLLATEREKAVKEERERLIKEIKRMWNYPCSCLREQKECNHNFSLMESIINLIFSNKE